MDPPGATGLPLALMVSVVTVVAGAPQARIIPDENTIISAAQADVPNRLARTFKGESPYVMGERNEFFAAAQGNQGNIDSKQARKRP